MRTQKRLRPHKVVSVLSGKVRNAGNRPGTINVQMSIAEGVAAAFALVVIEDVVVDRAADHGACSTAGCAAKQGFHHGTGKAADGDVEGAGYGTQRWNALGPRQRFSDTMGSAGKGSDDTANLAGEVSGNDFGGTAPRTADGGGHISSHDWDGQVAVVQAHGECAHERYMWLRCLKKCLVQSMLALKLARGA